MSFSSLKEQVGNLKSHTYTIYFAIRDPAMPWPVKVLAFIVVAYALSPIDLIPDFIPVLGYLDDLVLVPLGLALVLRFTPKAVLDSAKLKAEQLVDKPVNYPAAAVVIVIWLAVLFVCVRYVLKLFLSGSD